MKQFFIILAIFGMGFGGFSQDGKEKKANEAYENFAFDEAVERYGKLENVKSLEIRRREALSYWKLHQTESAEAIYQEIVTTEGHKPADLYNYACILRENGKYKESEDWMRKYAGLNKSDTRAKMYLNERGAYQRLIVDNRDFKIRNLEMNSEHSDFAAVFYREKIAFTSSREGTKPIRRNWNRNRLPFLDIYIAEQGENNNLVDPILIGKKINKKWHEGPVTFNKEGTFMVFTRSNYDGVSESGYVRLQLFSSELRDGQWTDPVPLPFNDNEYSIGHGAISGDGKWLYFASNMPGGMGGVDLYKAEILGGNTYGEMINLGSKINTEGDEMFPFVHAENGMLFFSSNGRVGLGGLDVFMAQLKSDQSIGKVTNLGAPVNGKSDDFAFVLNESQTMGYFSSNREGGKGNDDIYSFDLANPFSFGKVIKGVAHDKNGVPLANTAVTLFDLITGDEETVICGNDGAYEFLVEEDKTFNLRGQKEEYFDGTNSADTQTDDDVIIANLLLEKDPGLSIYALITDGATGLPMEGVKISIKDNITGETEMTYTTKTGDYLLALVDKKIDDRGSYDFSLEKNGYLAKTVTFDVVFTEQGRYNVHEKLNLTLEPLEEGIDLSDIVDLNPIYFDKGKSTIRPDAALELDKIVKVMNENPTMVVELGSHTDSQGSARSNESLSDKRAKASAQYIKERITNPNRIYGKGYGESVPNTFILEDGSEVELTEEFINNFRSSDPDKFDQYHQKNRRTEFIVIRM